MPDHKKKLLGNFSLKNTRIGTLELAKTKLTNLLMHSYSEPVINLPMNIQKETEPLVQLKLDFQSKCSLNI
jgi:hypothetical protein